MLLLSQPNGAAALASALSSVLISLTPHLCRRLVSEVSSTETSFSPLVSVHYGQRTLNAEGGGMLVERFLLPSDYHEDD
jgi:hypothetical protein